jgi:ferritin-like metal-binding protein YciE
MYEALKSYAEAIGDQDVVQVAEEIQSEEKQAAERLWPMIAKYASASLGKAYPA